jgi:RNA polymerase sigma factor for flagellar operon FliA
VIVRDNPEASLLDEPTTQDDPESERFVEPEPVRTPAEIDALVREGLPFVASVAAQVARQLGRLADREELEGVGRLALVAVARAFDPEKASFVGYARTKLRWAMLDAVRRETHGRAFAARARALVAAERVAEGSTHAPAPEATEAAHATRLRSVLAAQAAAMALALSAPFVDEQSSNEGVASPRDDRSPTPEDAVALRRQAVALRDGLSSLPPRQRALVERHYFGEERFDHIAESLGVSKSWASRLHAQALEQLAVELRRSHD